MEEKFKQLKEEYLILNEQLLKLSASANINDHKFKVILVPKKISLEANLLLLKELINIPEINNDPIFEKFTEDPFKVKIEAGQITVAEEVKQFLNDNRAK